MKKLFTFCFVLALATTLTANNISISNLSLTGKNTTGQYTMVQFDISWENSWRASTAASNWDAAWVFVKYRVAGGAWQHAWLNDEGHTAPAGSSITPGLLTPDAAFNATTNPGLGAFIYRSVNATASTFTNLGAQLRWNYGANGVANGDQVEIKVFAIEMVYVPQGAFKVGSGGTERGSFTNGSWSSGSTIALSISSENAFTIGQSIGNLWGTSSSGTSTIGPAGILPTAFPKGYAAFYSMKYEISQQQYVDFLNTLTQAQATTRKYTASFNRYAITGNTVGSYATANPFVACNFLSWMDGAAYADWAGMRPMTELEFEKASRGTVAPMANEYAWGTTAIASAAYTVSNGGQNNEAIATNYSTAANTGNASYNTTDGTIDGPLRVGIFASHSSNTGHITAGASYYGIMELSGNLWERPVTVGNATGRAYTGVHGNGALSANGHANETAWPGLTNGEVTDAIGSGFRGGSWSNNSLDLQVSDRINATYTIDGSINDFGFRAVRTQPPFTCGISTFTINHLASGNVAPVNKTVTYGTVSTSLFGGTKCAITQNLGSTNQASSATDATEASAGWYWQFNRKQGYKADCANESTCFIPSSPAWNPTITETSDWTAANDPCTLELGTGWRIPTNTEWTAASENGSWGNYTDTYNSVLKLHAAGNLAWQTGSLEYRGFNGEYWSSEQSQPDAATMLHIASNAIQLSMGLKSFGYTLRCVKELLPTLTTTAVTSITNGTASSGGNATGDGGSAITARGVCWGTSIGPTTALDTKTTDGTGTGSFTSAITGLAASTLYYVRAYATNSAGTSYGNEVSFTTAAFVCGTSSLSINHLTTDGVAPVNKSVTYGTVSTTLYGGSKCAITKNLGATNQATSAIDNTEASAGWYWQFNRKQGYKADCANESTCFIPSSPAWNPTINETSDWTAANDPCTLELGTGWRIPTNIEWFVADQNGSWNNYDNTYASVLKLHAAGYLLNSDGLLLARGSGGIYWSSTQYEATLGDIMYFDNGSSYTASNFKSYGYSVRCLKDLLPTLTTTAVTAITNSTATSGGNVADSGGYTVTARGVCWGTSTGPTIALTTKTTDGTGTGTFTSSITGLAASTLYYVRAYATNTAGTSYGNEVSFTTTAFVCETSILTVNHVTTRGVAPVNKTVTYGTVSTSLFGGTKCAITQNLGSTNQASSATDATEASAGWYWQFNRKQGWEYNNSLVPVTPAWNPNPDNGPLTWEATKDPCTLELGAGWRIPTSTEWVAADGPPQNWVNYTAPYNSELKLHAAGFLEYTNGSLGDRDYRGFYWSSTQAGDPNFGWNLHFTSSFSIIDYSYKAYGCSVRCVKD